MGGRSAASPRPHHGRADRRKHRGGGADPHGGHHRGPLRPRSLPPTGRGRRARRRSRRTAPHDTSPSLIAPTMAVPPAPPPRPVAGRSRRRPAFVAGAPREPEGPAAANGSRPSRSRMAQPAGASPRPRRQPRRPDRHALEPALGHRPAAGGASRRLLIAAPPLVQRRERRRIRSRPRRRSARPRRQRDSRASAKDAEPRRPASGDWKIQIGATGRRTRRALCSTAPGARAGRRSRAARPMTEKVQKGAATLYRARFAGLGPEQAEAACKTLKRSGFACFTTRD